MPGSAHAVKLADGCDLARGADTAYLREMATDEIDQPPADQIEPFVWIVEEFAHRYWRRTLLTQNLEVPDVFRRERVFQKKEPVRFDFFGQPNRVDGRKPLVRVME